MVPGSVQAWLEENGFGAVESVQGVGGGCINNGTRVKTTDGDSFFLKTNPGAPADMFAREAEGLVEMAKVGGGPRVPTPHHYGRDFLLLEDLNPAQRNPNYWINLGQQLARLHLETRSEFGFHHDNYIGSTPQSNTWEGDGYIFFAEQRLGYQAHLAHRRGLLGADEVGQVERLAGRLDELVPKQPASLIHGDLWGGNAISDNLGDPALIDPAAHYGWAEAELAMTSLFGGFADAFYGAYEEIRPLERGWRGRFPIYNLYHLLNHVNLFGGGYKGQVSSILQRYG